MNEDIIYAEVLRKILKHLNEMGIKDTRPRERMRCMTAIKHINRLIKEETNAKGRNQGENIGLDA